MRQILFRGKRLHNGEWATGDYVCQRGGSFIGLGSDVFTPVDPATVGQYTGLKDKKSKAIFEGDIVKAIAMDERGRLHDITGPVLFEEFEYVIDSDDEYWPCVSWKCVGTAEVIGNIHDKEK